MGLMEPMRPSSVAQPRLASEDENESHSGGKLYNFTQHYSNG